MRLVSMFLLVFFVIGMMACGSKPPPPPEPADVWLPEWWDPPQDPNYLFATATKTSRDMGLATSKAATDGRNDIAKQMEVRIQSLTKSFNEEIGLDEDAELLSQYTEAVKEVVSQTMVGSKVTKKEIKKEGNMYRAYVLVELPIGEANAALMQKIKANNNMYTRFRASQAFEDLDKEVEKYEQFKKEQGGMGY
ncbi:MAG: LPP20 family lipoprotein [candidate division Zixibacteria bacterium]|nr:LPP20 family lipoprotein [candidate division Zixibacteria bacterium]